VGAQLRPRPGLSAPIVTSIPAQWSPEWFRQFITNFLTIQNAVLGTSIYAPNGEVLTADLLVQYIKTPLDAEIEAVLEGFDTSGFALKGIAQTISGQWTFQLPILEGNGSAAEPAYSFVNETTTGVYWPGPGSLGFTVQGTEQLALTPEAATFTSQILASMGSASAPAYSFSADPTSGMYVNGDGSLGFAVDGGQVFEFGPAGQFGIGGTPDFGTANEVLHGNATGAPTWSAVDLTADVVNALPIGNGGTGQITKAAAFNALSPLTTAGDILYGGTGGAGTRLPAGSSTQVLISGTAPSWATLSGLAVTSIAGTAGEIDVSAPTGAVTISIDSGYVGQTSITTLGTIATGVWDGTTITIASGGTGQTSAAAAFNALSPMTTAGDLIYGGASGAGTRLAATTNGYVLTLVGGSPAWSAPATSGTVTSVALADGSTTAIYGITGSPVTGSGTLTFSLKTQSANLVLAGPTTGSAAQPTFRALVAADIPSLAYVTSVGLSLPGIFNVTGSPVTGSGTLTGALATQSANLVWAGPATGSAAAPTFRALVAADLPLATTSAFGAVKPDGSTITISGGVISAVASGSGTVTTVSVVSANGFAGTVANATTTPAITISTSITGILKGNGTAISAATSGTDYSAGTSALATGILKSTTTTGALTIAVAGDFPTLNQNTTGSAGSLASGGFANPSASIGLTAVSGSALTAMRSDGAPALSQAISPNWTGTHSFAGAWDLAPTTLLGVTLGVADSTLPVVMWSDDAQAADNRLWIMYSESGVFHFGTLNDANSASRDALVVTRSSASVTGIQVGNTTDLPMVSIDGTIDVVSSVAGGVNNTFQNSSSSASAYNQIALANDGGQKFFAVLSSSTSGGILAGYSGITAGLYTATGYPIVFAPAGVVRQVISTAGVITFNAYGAGTLTTNASGVITASSDERIKRDIEPFARGLDAVLALRPVTHSYTKASGLDDGHRYTGFLAQDVRGAIPEAVGQQADGLLTLSDRPIIAALVNSVRELNARITELEKAA
jgi:Chaperone of endosialidase